MRLSATIFLAFAACLAAAGIALGGDPGEPAITFARSGGPAEVGLQASKNEVLPQTVVLTAFGRRWTEPVKVKGSSARFEEVPSVRVPVVFSIVAPHDNKKPLGEVIAYPQPTLQWPKGTAVFGIGPPAWFLQWAHAASVPVELLAGLETLTPARRRAKAKAGGEVNALLVVGQDAAGENPEDVLRLAERHRTNVLVLVAKWAARRRHHKEPLKVQPQHMVGPLSEMQSHQWRKVPGFPTQRLPWAGIANRRPWVAGKAYPLVEELVDEKLWPRRVVISYVPWERQLGRSEIADLVFQQLLLAAAKPAEEKAGLAGRVEMLYPQEEKVTAKERPVLRAALEAGKALDDAPVAHRPPDAGWVLVLDLRGDQLPEAQLEDTLKQFQDRIGARRRLLILGDDPLLDRLHLGLDRTKRTSDRRAVIWLPTDAVPPTLADQVQLMHILTELRVQLNN